MARRFTLVPVLLLAAALSVPAAAEPRPGIGAGTQIAGTITASTVFNQLPSGALARSDASVMTVPGYDVHGACTYTGIVLPNNKVDIVFAGVGSASAVVVPPQVAQGTEVRCDLYNAVQQTHATFLNGTLVSATEGLAQNWDAGQLHICITVTGYFGPINPVDVSTGNPPGTPTCDEIIV